MRQWVLPIRQDDQPIFDLLATGKKTIETRAGGKYDYITAGDVVIFICGDNQLKREVLSVQRFRSIEELLASIPVGRIMPWVGSNEEAIKAYNSFPGYRERIAKHGIVAFELK